MLNHSEKEITYKALFIGTTKYLVLISSPFLF